jgi:quinol monooxygenase YgiN
MTNSTTGTAFYVRHKARPGKRDELREVWEKYARDYIAAAGVQLAYFYCYDDNDPDVIVAFQLCTDRAGVDDFVKQLWFRDYEAETAALLAERSEYRAVTPVWTKGAAR